MLQKIAFFIMRISIGLVFLLFGIGKLNNDIWAQTIRAMDVFQHLPWDVNCTVVLIGISEIMTGSCLIIGLFTRIFSSVAALQLATILVLLKFGETRDIGLFGVAVYTALVNQESWGVDGYLREGRDGFRRLKKGIVLVAVLFLMVLLGSLVWVKGNWQGGFQASLSVKQFILSGKLEHGVRTITIKASKYKFEPDLIVVRAGEYIRLVITSADTEHGFTIAELNINETIPAGGTKSFEFMAPGKGIFTAHCSVYCGSGHKDMSAAFIVIG